MITAEAATGLNPPNSNAEDAKDSKESQDDTLSTLSGDAVEHVVYQNLQQDNIKLTAMMNDLMLNFEKFKIQMSTVQTQLSDTEKKLAGEKVRRENAEATIATLSQALLVQQQQQQALAAQQQTLLVQQQQQAKLVEDARLRRNPPHR